tara:strand:+ start:73 stop:264 length:192 start_codon:yes stop_codon:yes gene_type:complete
MKLLKTTDMNRFNLSVMLLQSGLYAVIGLITILVMNLAVFGDSMTPKNVPTLHQSTPKELGPQ